MWAVQGQPTLVYWQLMGRPLEIITIRGAIGDELCLYIYNMWRVSAIDGSENMIVWYDYWWRANARNNRPAVYMPDMYARQVHMCIHSCKENTRHV